MSKTLIFLSNRPSRRSRCSDDKNAVSRRRGMDRLTYRISTCGKRPFGFKGFRLFASKGFAASGVRVWMIPWTRQASAKGCRPTAATFSPKVPIRSANGGRLGGHCVDLSRRLTDQLAEKHTGVLRCRELRLRIYILGDLFDGEEDRNDHVVDIVAAEEDFISGDVKAKWAGQGGAG